ncbi:MAG: hypothetical protein JXR48_18425 [Candidatus Delongbacteria bacterium]|nr:hypothetical protein [Candidatus Delongbacteria bacterium]
MANFLSVATILGAISAGRIEFAIVLPEKNKDAGKVFRSSIYFIIFVSLASFLFFSIFRDLFFRLTNFTNLGDMLLLTILWGAIFSLYQVLTNWKTRESDFKHISLSRVYQGLTASSSKIGIGLVHPFYSVLISGELLSYFISTYALIKKSVIPKFSFLKIGSDINYTWKHYKSFILFNLPTGLLNSFAMQMIVYFLSAKFERHLDGVEDIVGAYSQAWRVINMPLNILTIAFSNVFFKKIRDTINPRRIYLYSLLFNTCLSFFMLFPFMFIGEWIFSFFGDEWIISGTMAAVLVPLSVMSFATGSVSSIFMVKNRNDIVLVWQIIYIALCWFMADLFVSEGVIRSLLAFSVTGTIMYIILALIGLYLSGRNNDEK